MLQRLVLAIKAAHQLHVTDDCAVLFVAVHEDMLSEDALNEDDNSKHVSSTFRGVYKRKFDTKWRAEITAGIPGSYIFLCGTNMKSNSACVPKTGTML